MCSIQGLDALLVILAQSQRVGEGVVCGHDGSRRTGVLQAQDVPELMGSNLEKVCACGGSRQAAQDGKPHLVHTVLRNSLRRLF